MTRCIGSRDGVERPVALHEGVAADRRANAKLQLVSERHGAMNALTQVVVPDVAELGDRAGLGDRHHPQPRDAG